MVHGFTDLGAYTSELYWVDATTGEQQSFASYTPNFTVLRCSAPTRPGTSSLAGR